MQRTSSILMISRHFRMIWSIAHLPEDTNNDHIPDTLVSLVLPVDGRLEHCHLTQQGSVQTGANYTAEPKVKRSSKTGHDGS